MNNLAIHARTLAKLTTIEKELPHAVLLSGESGVGLATIAKAIAGREVATYIEPLDNKGNPDHTSGTISVAIIRNLYDQTRAKSLARRVYIIDDADRMSAGASAAFLKLLEEPTEHTHFILTSHAPQVLLPTVRSRLQTITVEPISATQTKQFISTLHVTDETSIRQFEYLAAGLPAELVRLSLDSDYFKARAEIMSDTRTFLTGTPYQKILVVHKYQQSRPQALQLLDSALLVTKRSLTAKPQPNLAKQLSTLLSARERIEANGNIRLHLLAFVVQ